MTVAAFPFENLAQRALKAKSYRNENDYHFVKQTLPCQPVSFSAVKLNRFGDYLPVACKAFKATNAYAM